MNRIAILFSKRCQKAHDLIKTNSDEAMAMHSVPESLYSFRFLFSQISVFYNRKFLKIREIAEFIPNQLHFHKKKL